MRVILAALGLLTLAACAQPTSQQTANNDMTKYVEATDGAPYPQSDYRYYLTGQIPPNFGGFGSRFPH